MASTCSFPRTNTGSQNTREVSQEFCFRVLTLPFKLREANFASSEMQPPLPFLASACSAAFLADKGRMLLHMSTQITCR